jgi:hypothetical protein
MLKTTKEKLKKTSFYPFYKKAKSNFYRFYYQNPQKKLFII